MRCQKSCESRLRVSQALQQRFRLGCVSGAFMIDTEIASGGIEFRAEPEKRAFLEAHRLLVAFGVSAIPATLVLGLMGADFLEGDFGLAGTVVMTMAGCVSVVCAVVGVVARRRWAEGKPLDEVLAVMSWPPLLMVTTLFASLLAFAANFSFLLGGK